MHAKAHGAYNLDKVSRGIPSLEHFVLWSSLMAAYGNEGDSKAAVIQAANLLHHQGSFLTFQCCATAMFGKEQCHQTCHGDRTGKVPGCFCCWQ